MQLMTPKHIRSYDHAMANAIMDHKDHGASCVARCLAELIEQTWSEDPEDATMEMIEEKREAVKRVVALAEWLATKE